MARNFKNLESLTPEHEQRRPQITVNRSGNVFVGSCLRRELRGKVKLGYWPDERVIVIFDNVPDGHKMPSSGQIRLPSLSIKLANECIDLPARFVFEQSEPGVWTGSLDVSCLRLRERKVKTKHINPELVVQGYSWIIDKLVYQYAKSTPIDERRRIATEALYQAACDYTAGYGPIKEYLIDKVRAGLLTGNKQYTKHYHDLSLDHPFKETEEENEVTPYAVIADVANTGLIGTLEDQIADAQFAQMCLDEHERSIFKMLTQGYTAEEIIKESGLEPYSLYELCADIGNRRADFMSAG